MRASIIAGTAMLAFAVTPVDARSQPSEPAMEARKKETVRAAFARWAAGGTTFFTDLLSPDVV